MTDTHGLSLSKVLVLTQWDKIVLTMLATCLLPLFVHALPSFVATDVGKSWLPIFYAPLIAGLCWRPHVSLLAALLAPAVNHLFFGMPDSRALPVLSFELFVFNAIIILVARRWRSSVWSVLPIFVLTRAMSVMIFGHLTAPELADMLLRSLNAALPGMIMLMIIAAIVNLLKRGAHDQAGI